MPANAYSRKKQPDLVRRALLDEAAQLAMEGGLSAVTVQAVAAAAGVTKGGLFHHFASKQALVEAMFADVMERFDAEIDANLPEEVGEFGRFTRAYVETLLGGSETNVGETFDMLSAAMMTDANLAVLWSDWLRLRMERHRDTDSDPSLEIVRFAADGAWLNLQCQGRARSSAGTIRERIVAMIGQQPPAIA
ncbi:MAG: TetR/AcrR family transcriptional regulator [Devosia sp.]|uniref:TetR/AcrR family transcriptional regulator n=1 Tax=Devosia sp. TaxID=1871048 RepID=UPI0024C9C832|nr:TetR/AcrR family transcriptional regulator [Devosia sp.]UYO00023.1 MAG: TetR/AcrR family transcriptional regulator [Devosia sp.]